MTIVTAETEVYYECSFLDGDLTRTKASSMYCRMDYIC